MQFLKANTEIKVRIGPFVDVGDAFTPETGITLGAADEAELLKNNGAATVSLAAATWAAIASCDGWYDLTLTTSHTDTEGLLTVVVQDDSVCLPVYAHFMVLSEAAFDSMFVAKDAGFMDVNIKTVGRADAQETEANNLESACSNYSATRGLTGTALPAAVADAAGGVPVSDAGGLDIDTLLGRLTANVATEAKQDIIDTVVDAIKAVTDVLPNSGALTDIDTGVNAIEAKLPTNYIMGSTVQTAKDDEIDAIKTVTDALPNNGALTDLATAAALATVDTVVDAIKAVTDNLPNSGALTSLATAASISALQDISAADVNAQVLDVLNTDTFDEPGDENPGSNVTLITKIGYLYKFLRNKTETTATRIHVYNAAESNKDQSSIISDDGTTATRGKFQAGD
jgi:hypothetical protein